jgi:hypothetical protein
MYINNKFSFELLVIKVIKEDIVIVELEAPIDFYYLINNIILSDLVISKLCVT